MKFSLSFHGPLAESAVVVAAAAAVACFALKEQRFPFPFVPPWTMIACVFIFVLDLDLRFSVNGQLVVNLVGGLFLRGILVYCCWIAYHGQTPTAIRSTIASHGHLMAHVQSPVFPPVVLSEASFFQGFNSPTVGVYVHFWEDSRNLQPMEHTQTGSLYRCVV